MNADDIERMIRNFFEENYETLRKESGHTLSEDVKKMALEQVLMYYRKLNHVADNVTRTEVSLSLQNPTVKGITRKFTLYGVVDIVKESDQVVMYDLKTHDAAYVRANPGDYQKQLEIYAHIWENIFRQRLDKAVIIASKIPDPLRSALKSKKEDEIQRELDEWEPDVELSLDRKSIEETLYDFYDTVRKIENSKFDCRPEKVLKAAYGKSKIAEGNKPSKKNKTTFASMICSLCDFRFSCDSFIAYSLSGEKGGSKFIKEYFNGQSENTDSDWLDDADFG